MLTEGTPGTSHRPVPKPWRSHSQGSGPLPREWIDKRVGGAEMTPALSPNFQLNEVASPSHVTKVSLDPGWGWRETVGFYPQFV